MKKTNYLIMIIFFNLILCGCTRNESILLLATTTSTEQTGLLDEIIPYFTQETGIPVKVIAVGTGQALELGRKGEVDVLLVHDEREEMIFIQEGFGKVRHDVMFNDFVLLGSEPFEENESRNIVEAFRLIEKKQLKFISRGDESGTHQREKAIWNQAQVEPGWSWYLSVGRGMGETLQMADEKKAYTLSDRATYLSLADQMDLIIVLEDPIFLKNQYGVIAVNEDRHAHVNAKEAMLFIDWICSDEIQEKIGSFGLEKYGQSLFYPNAKE